MMTDTAAHTPPLDQICWQIRADDYSVRAPNWCHFGNLPKNGWIRLPNPSAHGSIGAESRVAAWPPTLEEWRIPLQVKVATKAPFVPKTELGRKLWALRLKYIAEGGRLFTDSEIAEELERQAAGRD